MKEATLRGIEFRVYDKSIMVGGIGTVVWYARKPTDKDMDTLARIVEMGREQKANEIKTSLRRIIGL